ncbi:MAG TPA: hypothetical protein PKC08_02685, partial [Pseudomonadales bacterium]|nr:hypothetical protein [Pseudomonadales bacterium]
GNDCDNANYGYDADHSYDGYNRDDCHNGDDPDQSPAAGLGCASYATGIRGRATRWTRGRCSFGRSDRNDHDQ